LLKLFLFLLLAALFLITAAEIRLWGTVVSEAGEILLVQQLVELFL
jgi:hypothetical protein